MVEFETKTPQKICLTQYTGIAVVCMLITLMRRLGIKGGLVFAEVES